MFYTKIVHEKLHFTPILNFSAKIQTLDRDEKWTKKWHFLNFFSEPFIVGGQPDDDRIYVEERVERAPDYTEGEQE